MKRSMHIMTALCLAACLMTAAMTQTYAAVPSEGSGVIVPMMQYINSTECRLSIRNGTATVIASVRGQSGSVTKSEIKVVLQVKSGLFWKDYATWTDTQNSYRADIRETIAVASGSTYRAVATATVWNGSASETETTISASVKA